MIAGEKIKLFLFSIFLGYSLFINAQQESSFNMYMFNHQSFNAGYVGSKNYSSFTFLSRSQWIGFEGAPGIGKTSLARKGLAYCLKDADGTTRPFSFIALGGSSNGSFLEGHGYTYMNSTWGKIVDILMDSKCMNPIIYIDELDKVSKTEQGKEIIGILTHLIDPTQNTNFQDKYYAGIPIDISKSIFVFSFNHLDAINPILKDRMHLIKVDGFNSDDKFHISKNFLIPSLLKDYNLTDTDIDTILESAIRLILILIRYLIARRR